jgi:uncharacterized membrane protein
LSFPPPVRTAIEDAIRKAEAGTSGEIRVHVGRLSWGMPVLWAWLQFRKLKMHRTAGRTGILIYFTVEDRRFAIYGDRKISSTVGRGFWNDAAIEMERHFRLGDFARGIGAGVELVGEKLSTFFPRQPDDVNELPDVMTFDD